MTDDHPATRPTIKPRDNGPYRVDGLRLLIGADGERIRVEGRGKGNIALCRCGASESKPFCDGSHRDAGFVSDSREEAGAGIPVSHDRGGKRGGGDSMHTGARGANRDKTIGGAHAGAEPMIRITAGGPYVVTGNIELIATEWPTGRSRERYALCRCGHSGTKPFCDGSHAGVDFEDPGLDTTINGED